jgi:hypothetical protein
MGRAQKEAGTMTNRRFRDKATVSLLCLLLVSLASGTCGSSSSDGDTGPAGTPGPSDCRDYMTEATVQGPMPDGTIGTAVATGAYDPATNAYASTMVAPGVTMSVVRTYQSVADFVDEAKVVALDLCSTVTNSGSYNSTETYVYDSQRRVAAIQAFEPGPSGHGAFTWSYAAWDDKGRPTSGTLNVPSVNCQGMAVSIDYDDQLRREYTVINSAAGQGSGCGSQVYYSWHVFDGNGNVVDQVESSTDPNSPSTKTTPTKTARICK